MGIQGEADFYIANSGLTPPEKYSINDHMRAFFSSPAANLKAGSLNQYLLATGEETMSRMLAQSVVIANIGASGDVVLTYFYGRKTEQVTQIAIPTGNQAAGATPTLCKMGLYTVDASGNLTLVGATANDTSLWSVTFAGNVRTMLAPVNKVQGQRYAMAAIVVSGAALPRFAGADTPSATRLPIYAAKFSGQSDLPSNITNAQAIANSRTFYGELLP
jgi:hypothetical protein